MRKVMITSILFGLGKKKTIRKTDFVRKNFWGWSWFKFNKLGLAVGKALKFYGSMVNGLKLKARNLLELITKFGEVTGENW